MSLNVALHNPTNAKVTEFEKDGKPEAAVTFTSYDHLGETHQIKIFVAPTVAYAMADAFNTALRSIETRKAVTA